MDSFVVEAKMQRFVRFDLVVRFGFFSVRTKIHVFLSTDIDIIQHEQNNLI